MPYYEYECDASMTKHTITKFYKTFKEAEPFVDEVVCSGHGTIAKRVVSTPMPAHLYGNPDGFSKPSPTKRFTTKTVSERDGNKFSIG